MTDSSITPSSFAARQERLGAALREAGLDALALNPGPSLVYLTGLSFHLMERPLVALFFPDRSPLLVLPELETAKVEELKFPAQVITFGDNPATWAAVYRQAVQAAQIDGRRVGVEPRRLRVLELRLLEAAAPKGEFVSAEASLAALRIQKDESEVAAMRIAVDIAQRALQEALRQVHVGMTEQELASEVTLQLLRAGSQPEMPFSPIVSFGPNSANPHSIPGDRHLAEGDLLLIDWGATSKGYISDLTRTFAVGEVDQEYLRIAQVVAEANAAGRAAARPGLPAGDVDRAARKVIEQAGYGQYFFHRTGHGIGMEAHEEPYMYGENQLLLVPGMTFTVEPGIYLPGRAGVRIEDNLVITSSGADTLSSLPRDLLNVLSPNS
jgi:Xaa-Pro dipeptidase